MKAITALLTDIEKLDAYLHRYMSRAMTAQNALGMPGTRIFNRVLASVGKVRKEVAALEQQKASFVPLMEADERIRDLTLDIDRLSAENRQLAARLDKEHLAKSLLEKAHRQTKTKLNTLTTQHHHLQASLQAEKESVQ